MYQTGNRLDVLMIRELNLLENKLWVGMINQLDMKILKNETGL